MDWKEKYTLDKNDLTKKYISNEAYAICELIEQLISAMRSVK